VIASLACLNFKDFLVDNDMKTFNLKTKTIGVAFQTAYIAKTLEKRNITKRDILSLKSRN